jgi:hypothetical protein
MAARQSFIASPVVKPRRAGPKAGARRGLTTADATTNRTSLYNRVVNGSGDS